MEISKFSGRPVEIIKHYIFNFDNMDDQTQSNFSNLIITIIKGSDIISLIDIYSELDFEVANSNDKINTLILEITSRKTKIESKKELEQIAKKQGITKGDVLIQLNNEYREKLNQLATEKYMESMITGMCIHINNSIISKINSLSPEERTTLTSQFTAKTKLQEERINTLTLEMTSRKTKIENEIELEKIAQNEGTNKEDVLVKLNNEYKERWNEMKSLKQSFSIYSKYSEVLSNNSIKI